MSIRRRLSRLEERVPTGPELLEISILMEVFEPGDDGPVPTGDVFRSRYRIHDGKREILEELVPVGG